MNSLYIIYDSGGKQEMLQSPITEDFQVEAVSEFSTFAELCPTIDTLMNLATAYEGGSSGKVGASNLTIRSILDAPRWIKTNPTKITLDMHFYLESDPYEDIVKPMVTLLSLHILTKGKDGRFKIPGIYAGNVKEIGDLLTGNSEKAKKETKGLNEVETKALDTVKGRLSDLDKVDNKVISALIPGVLYLPYAYVHSVQPTYSKQTTQSGLPIWASANLTISSLLPANLKDFIDVWGV